MTEGKSDSSKAPLSVARVLQIIKVLSQSEEPVSLAELSRRLATPKTSLIGLLRGLVELEYVTARDGTYRLGGSSFDLAGAVLSSRQRSHMGDYVRLGMRALNAATGETVLYGVLTGETPQMMTYVELVESRNAIRISVGIGDRSPLYCTAGGRILLAGMSDTEVQRYLAATKLTRFTQHTETGTKRLLESVRDARQEHFSVVADEIIEGITGMAAPVMDNSSGVLGALIVAGPTTRIIENQEKLKDAILASSREISGSLGHRREGGLQ